jgi:hypothetical protein
MLRLLAFLSFILGGLAAFIYVAHTIEPWCSAPNRNQDNEQYQERNGEAAKQNQQPAYNRQTLQQVKSDDEDKTAENESNSQPWYARGWWKHFFAKPKLEIWP